MACKSNIGKNMTLGFILVENHKLKDGMYLYKHVQTLI